MVEVFLSFATFAQHKLLTLAPPSGYTLYPKPLIKVSKVSSTPQLLYEILRPSFERKFKKTNFISLKKNLPKNPRSLGLMLQTAVGSAIFFLNFQGQKLTMLLTKTCYFSQLCNILNYEDINFSCYFSVKICFSNLFWTKINLVIHIVPVLEPLLLVFSSGGSFVDEKDVFRVAMRSAFTNR